MINSANQNHLNGGSNLQFRIRKTQQHLVAGGSLLARPATSAAAVHITSGDEAIIRNQNYGQIQGGFSEGREDEDMERGSFHIEEIKKPIVPSQMNYPV